MRRSNLFLSPIGIVRTELTDPAEAPRQGYEGELSAEATSSCTPPCQSHEALAAWLEIDPEYAEGLQGIRVGSELILITWLHLASRDFLLSHPRGDRSQPLTGVFNSRSPHRPNPLGLHRVTVLAVEGSRIQVSPLEAVDGTPIVDIKPVMSGVEDW